MTQLRPYDAVTVATFFSKLFESAGTREFEALKAKGSD
jgi:hypothetical protein